MTRKNLHIMIIPEEKGKTVSFSLSTFWIYLTTILLTLVIIGIVVLIVNSAMDELKLVKLNYLKKENSDLREKLSRIEQLESDLDEANQNLEKIMIILGKNAPKSETIQDLETVSTETESDALSEITLSESGLFKELETFIAQNKILSLISPTISPIEGGWISRGFGKVIGGKSIHTGIDIAIPEGTPVKATAMGKVIFSGDDDIYGKMIIIEHGLSGYTTIYGHNSRLVKKVGETVNSGDIIAYSGQTGESTAPHLHYEIKYNGVPVDPIKYLP